MPEIRSIYALLMLSTVIWGLKNLLADVAQQKNAKPVAGKRLMAAVLGARLCWGVTALTSGMVVFVAVCVAFLLAAASNPNFLPQILVAIAVSAVIGWAMRVAHI